MHVSDAACIHKLPQWTKVMLNPNPNPDPKLIRIPGTLEFNDPAGEYSL